MCCLAAAGTAYHWPVARAASSWVRSKFLEMSFMNQGGRPDLLLPLLHYGLKHLREWGHPACKSSLQPQAIDIWQIHVQDQAFG
jgi:hypothetical protein